MTSAAPGEALHRTVRRNILARSGLPARLIRGGLASRPAWRGGLLAVARDAGLGDVLMTTPLLREAKLRNPAVRTVLYTTRYAALVRGLPYIDELRPFSETPPGTPYVGYEDAIAPRVPLAQIFADWVGLRLDDMIPDCVVQAGRIARFKAEWAGFPRPHIVVLRRASRWTPNKDWPDANWADLLERLGRAATIIEIGEPDPSLRQVECPNYVDLRGRTDLEDLPAAISACDLHIGPVSGPMHVAAAVGAPTVTICGGYESPGGHPYPSNTLLHVPTFCSPCWLQSPCPYQRACLTAITVETVEQAALDMLKATQGAPRRRPATSATSPDSGAAASPASS